jgi:pSer/pThr/pTyr-binding forkhead associated (FHA) protein
LLIDLSSTYGTSVNGQRIEQHRLKHGDSITFGRGDIEFRYMSGAVEVPVPAKDPSDVVARSIEDLNRVLPSGGFGSGTPDVRARFSEMESRYSPQKAAWSKFSIRSQNQRRRTGVYHGSEGSEFGFASGRDGKGESCLKSISKRARASCGRLSPAAARFS